MEASGWYSMLLKKVFSLAVIAVGGVVSAAHVSAQPSSGTGAAPMASESLPAPMGLVPCSPDDQVAALEKRIAPSLGVEFLSCFHSGASGEYALVHRVIGDNFTSADVEALRTKVAAQWKDFQPLSAEFHDKYIARLNTMITEASSTPAPIASIKPVLVSMKSLDSKSYSVVSIQSYVFNGSKGQESAERVNADAIVLRGRRIIRLTIQRKLTEVADVDDLQTDIARWAKAME
jgi:hypothetical protein